MRGFKELHIKILLIITLSLAVYSNLISPFVVGIGQGHIYYSINRNFGTFPIHKLNINNIGVIKLTIKKDKDYVRLEILRTQVYQIYRLKDLDKLKNIFHGNKIIIDDRSKSR